MNQKLKKNQPAQDQEESAEEPAEEPADEPADEPAEEPRSNKNKQINIKSKPNLQPQQALQQPSLSQQPYRRIVMKANNMNKNPQLNIKSEPSLYPQQTLQQPPSSHQPPPDIIIKSEPSLEPTQTLQQPSLSQHQQSEQPQRIRPPIAPIAIIRPPTAPFAVIRPPTSTNCRCFADLLREQFRIPEWLTRCERLSQSLFTLIRNAFSIIINYSLVFIYFLFV